ncbi:MAG: hypothetical protein WAQ28_02045 [Bacteroidia bacterium]
MSTKLRILKGIPTLLADQKKLLKPVSVFYCLKAAYKTSVIIDYNGKITQLAELCYCSPRTLYTRIKELHKLGLIKITSGRIELVSYSKMHEAIKVKENRGKYHYKKQTAKPEYILRAAAIQENLDRQEARVMGIIERYNEGSGLSDAEKKQKKEADLQRLIVAFKNPALLHRGIEDIFYQPDVAISQNTLASIYGLKSQGSGLYWQIVLKKHKLLQIESRLIESNVRCRHSSLGIVFYSRKTQKTYCQMPNKILCL